MDLILKAMQVKESTWAEREQTQLCQPPTSEVQGFQQEFHFTGEVSGRRVRSQRREK